MIIYADGACTSSNPGNAACRIVAEQGGQRDVITKELGFHSNNYAELYGILMAMEYLLDKSICGELANEQHIIYSDSRIALGWMINAPKLGVLDYRELMLIIDRIHEIKIDFPKLHISHWNTRELGEIPADFGHKRPRKT